jgi:F-type H+-transporting ATPase subunit g
VLSHRLSTSAIDNTSNAQTLQNYLTPVQNALRNPSSLLSRSTQAAQQSAQQASQTAANNPQTILNQVRNFDTATLTSAGIVLAEVIGFFTVGEMIGRRQIVGYRGEHGEHH